MIPGIFGGQTQVDPWRQQMQQMYGADTFGGRNGHQALSGPATMQAYAMSGQGRHLNSGQSGSLGGTDPGMNPLSGLIGSPGGGGLSEMIRQVLHYQQQQALLGGGQTDVRIPTNPLAPIRKPGGGLLGAY